MSAVLKKAVQLNHSLTHSLQNPVKSDGTSNVNSLWPSDAIIWWHRSGSALPKIMACCLTAPSYYLKQCCHLTSEVLWYSHESTFTVIAHDTFLYNEFENYKLLTTSPRGQWLNSLRPSDAIWRQRSGSTLDQVMACCLTAPSHYLQMLSYHQ